MSPEKVIQIAWTTIGQWEIPCGPKFASIVSQHLILDKLLQLLKKTGMIFNKHSLTLCMSSQPHK